MPRWEGDGRERLEQAALDLFLEIGYEATTVAAIARRAGLTERSFYRHFPDKREVLFARDDVLIDHITDQLRQALQTQNRYPAVLAAMASAGTVFLPREAVQRRVSVIERSTALSERERSKLTTLSDAVAAVLSEHGCTTRDAHLLASLGLSALLVASEDRMTDTSPFGELVQRAADDQYRLITGSDEPPTCTGTSAG